MSTVVTFPTSLARQPLMTARGALPETELARTRSMIAAFALAEAEGSDATSNVIDFTLYRWAVRRAETRGPVSPACPRRTRRRMAIRAIAAAASRPLAPRAEAAGWSEPLEAA